MTCALKPVVNINAQTGVATVTNPNTTAMQLSVGAGGTIENIPATSDGSVVVAPGASVGGAFIADAGEEFCFNFQCEETPQSCDTILDCAASVASVVFTDLDTVANGTCLWQIDIDFVGCDGTYVGDQNVIGLQSTVGTITFISNTGLTNTYRLALPASASAQPATLTWGRQEDDELCQILHSFPACIVEVPTHDSLGTLRTVPNIIGHGTDITTGGRGGPTRIVTSLADSGPGTLRDATVGKSGAVIFAVGGRCDLQNPISMDGDITVFGQTAPGNGFEVRNTTSATSNEDVIELTNPNVALQHFAILGDPAHDPLDINGGNGLVNRILILSMSVSGANDENMQMWRDFQDITIARTIFAEPQGTSSTRKGPLFDASSRTLDSGRISFFQNFMIHGIGRWPFFAGVTVFDQYNNAVYNAGNWRAQYRDNGQDVEGNHFSNAYEHGPNSPDPGTGKDINMLVSGGGSLRIFVQDNYNITGNDYDRVNNPQFWTPPPAAYTDCPLMPVIWPGNQVKANLPGVVGPRNIASGNQLWTPDVRRLNEWATGTGSWPSGLNSPQRPTVNSNPLLDLTEPDGVPKAYKTRCGIAHGTDTNTVIGADGYSELERWVYTGMQQS